MNPRGLLGERMAEARELWDAGWREADAACVGPRRRERVAEPVNVWDARKAERWAAGHRAPEDVAEAS
jgi:hypothetical protein